MGIAGIISEREEALVNINAITDIVTRRGPNGQGIYKKDNMAFGHRRLSIFDLSELGNQPIYYRKALQESVDVLNPLINDQIIHLFNKIVADRTAFDFILEK